MNARVFVRLPLFAVSSLVMLSFAAPAQAQTTYACNVEITPFTSNTCSGAVALQPFSFGSLGRQVVVDLNQTANWQSVTLRVQVCDSSGWTIHIGDSPTNNGGAGDGGSTRHDAEAQALDAVLSVFKADVGSGPIQSCQYSPPPSTAGCITQEWRVTPDTLTFDRSINSFAPLDICANSALFDFPPYDEADSEDTGNLYADKLYFGLNRTYGDASRSGTGVQKACFYLSTAANPSQAIITSACGF